MIAIVDWSPELVGFVMFWTGILQCAWTFALYPASIYVLARLYPKKPTKLSMEEQFSVTVLIAAHNEEDRIRDRIKNILECEYQRVFWTYLWFLMGLPTSLHRS